MDINKTRESVVNGCTETSLMSGERLPKADDASIVALALVYLGDSIREGTSDIGPALKDAGDRIGVETSSVAEALGNIGRDMVR